MQDQNYWGAIWNDLYESYSRNKAVGDCKKKNKYPGMYVVGYEKISKKETTMFLPGRVIENPTRFKISSDHMVNFFSCFAFNVHPFKRKKRFLFVLR